MRYTNSDVFMVMQQSVSRLQLWLYAIRVFTKFNSCRKLCERYIKPLFTIFATFCEYIIISKYKVQKEIVIKYVLRHLPFSYISLYELSQHSQGFQDTFTYIKLLNTSQSFCLPQLYLLIFRIVELKPENVFEMFINFNLNIIYTLYINLNNILQLYYAKQKCSKQHRIIFQFCSSL